MQQMSSEDYIKAVYKLERTGKKVATSSLAAQLQLTDASITDMVKKLSEKGLLKYQPYQGVELTVKGRRMALRIVRRHRLWEMFLAKFLGFSWDQIHGEAERLEHVTSDELERRIDKALGYPTVDPHGDPIPSIDGVMDGSVYLPLASFEPGSEVRIHRVSDANPEILLHATKMGLALNTKLVVKEKMAFDGSMVVKVGSRQKFLSQQVADAIFVEAV
jgi:DtxR family Mn-dependent transcriptional regulator